jgi:NAD(P)-dependent dehydrogenase (short-subunit alcohol dehydrogenase family)
MTCGSISYFDLEYTRCTTFEKGDLKLYTVLVHAYHGFITSEFINQNIRMTQNNQKCVLITGASDGGIGSALALEFQRRGVFVFAAVRDPKKAANLASLSRVHVVTLDVTAEPSIAAAVELVRNVNHGRGVDILVNNSGVVHTMPLVDSSLEDGKNLFDVNFWGTLALVKAFTPQLMETKGMVVNISSVGSIVNTPWIGEFVSNCVLRQFL